MRRTMLHRQLQWVVMTKPSRRARFSEMGSFQVKRLRLGPIFDHQSWHACKFTHIVGHQDEVVAYRLRSE